ncbi:PEGA domain-containing protein [Sorangium sp. So ce1078]|uniref:PEGA domain-containing protein n=1 Tax=Sorangium sp. So ce1078 TaxID=3133329 RepID=UPI003F5D820F
MMNQRCLASVLALACALAPSGRALAQPAPPASAAPTPSGSAAPAPPASAARDEATARADALYKRGVRLYSEKKWKEAEAVFLEAWALAPTFDVAYNVGSAAYQQGKHARAAEHLSFALQHWPLISAVAHLKPTAEQRLATSRAQVGALAVTVTAPLAEVLVDGKPAGKAPLEGELFVEPGEHTVEARLDGYAPAQKSVRVAKGETAEVTLTLAAAKSSTAANPEEKEETTAARHAAITERLVAKPGAGVAVPARVEQRSWVPVIALGAASAVALGVAVGMTVASNDANDQARAQSGSIHNAGGQCIEPSTAFTARCAELDRLGAKADSLGDVAFGAYIASGVTALAAITYALWPKRTGTRSMGVSVRPNVGLHSSGIILVGAW